MSKTDTAPRKTTDALVSLASRAECGDRTAMPALLEALKDPAAVDLLGGDLARQAQLKLIDKLGGENLLLKAGLTRKLDLLREELSGPSPTPLERLLVDRVATCWLHLHHLEAVYAGEGGRSRELGAYLQRCISLAQKRYLAAIRTLALVRRLEVPTVLLNVAQKQQVNVHAEARR